MSNCKKKSNSSAKSAESYCSSCPSQPKFVEEKKTCHPLTSHVAPSFSHAKESRTPFDLYWNNYYKKHVDEMDYDIVPVKEDLIIEYCEPANSGPITHKPAGTIHWVPNCKACGESADGQTVNFCEEANKNQFLPSSIGYYTQGDNLNGGFNCDQITSSTPTVRFGEGVYILENNQQGILYLGPQGSQYSIPTWDKFDEYYEIIMGNDTFNNSVFLVFGSKPSIAVCVCFNASPKGLVLEQYVYADCGTWYLINNVNENNGFSTIYGTYDSQKQQFTEDEGTDWVTTNNLKIGGTDKNPIQVAIEMFNKGDGEATMIFLQYYVDGNNCYIRPIGGKNE